MRDWQRMLRSWSRRPSGRLQATVNAAKFDQRPPQAQNAIDIFRDRWASDLSDVVPGVVSGPARHFGSDARPVHAMQHLARSAGMTAPRILELGPLEGGHTYQLDRLGAAEIVAVESNVEAYLKCLIAKELTGIKNARFLLGDFVEHLKQDRSLRIPVMADRHSI